MTIHIREAVPDDLAEVLDMMGHLAAIMAMCRKFR